MLQSIIFLFLFSLLWLREARAQIFTTNATCSQYGVLDNSLGQNPCLVAAYLYGVCAQGGGTVPALTSQVNEYQGPTSAEANPCTCSSVLYSMVAACAACQGYTFESWGQWTASCPQDITAVGSWSQSSPSGTVVPGWAFGPLTSSNDPSFNLSGVLASKEKHGLSGGAIAGIITAVIVLLGAVGGGIWFFLRRRRQRQKELQPMFEAAAELDRALVADVGYSVSVQDPPGYSPAQLYNPNDPATYPLMGNKPPPSSYPPLSSTPDSSTVFSHSTTPYPPSRKTSGTYSGFGEPY